MANPHTYIDLFAGCGGLALGLYNAGWKGLFAIEKSKDAFLTLEHNLIDKKKHFSWVAWLPQRNYSINYVIQKYKIELESLKGQVDMVTGGPPCQGFSMAGRRNESDHRNNLVKSYIRFIKLVEPKIIFFENVKGFTLEFKKNRDKGKVYSEYVIKRLDKLGYHVYGKLINFAEYGIPQKRTRFILVGIRKNIPESNKKTAEKFFEMLENNRTLFFQNKNLPINPNLGDAIADLLRGSKTEVCPDSKSFQSSVYAKSRSNYQEFMRQGVNERIPDSHRFAKHGEHIIERFQYILQNARKNKDIGREIKDRFSLKKQQLTVLDKDKKSPTLTTLPDDYIHYEEPRILTVREYARIQSFPDWYEFKGKYTTGGHRRKIEVPRYTQVGNAIPPLFSEQSGLILKQMIE